MLTALFLIAIFFGLIQEVKAIGKLRFISGYRARKQSIKRSALIAVTEKTKP
jgi:hypothetical protein